MSTKISIHNYNEGASSGRYALNNLSNAGKFANFLYAVPQRFVLTFSGSGIILKQGSMVPILNGTGNNPCLYQVMPKDVTSANYSKPIKAYDATTFSQVPANYQFVVYNATANKLEWGPSSNYTYAEATNLFTNKAGNKCSCPLGVIDANGMLKPFNAISFCGNLIFVDMGVEYDRPAGLDNAGRQKEQHVFIPSMKVSKTGTVSASGELKNLTMLLDDNGAVTLTTTYEARKTNSSEITSAYWYCINDNVMYSRSGSKNTVVNFTKAAKVDLLNGAVKQIHEPNFFYGSKFADSDILNDVTKIVDVHKAEADKMCSDIEAALVSLNTYVAKSVTDFNNIKPTLNEKTGEFTWKNGRPDLEKEPPVIRK